MVKLLLSTYHFFSKRKLFLFGLLAVLFLFFVFATSRIHFKEDISAFLPKEQNTERINNAYQHIGSANTLIVSVSMAELHEEVDEELIIDAVNFFVNQLNNADRGHRYFKKIEYHVDQQQILSVSQFLIKNMPYFLTESDYWRMDTLLMEEQIRKKMLHNKQILSSPLGGMMKYNILSDPLSLAMPLLTGLQNFRASEQFQIYNDYIFSIDGKEGFVFIESQFSASETRRNAALLKLLDNAITQTQLEYNHEIKLNYFGAVDIAVTNANRIKKDTLISSTIAIILILSILIFVFRSTRSLMVVLGSLLFGWLFALGLLSFFSNEVSLIAVGISSIIIGIAVNYPLHFMMRKKHVGSTSHVIKDIVVPLTIGNITTVGAFLSLTFMSSDAMRDLGLFAALLLIGTILFVLLFLPHLLKKNQKLIAEISENEDIKSNSSQWKFKLNKWNVFVFILLTVVLCVLSFNTKFETDMNKINYMTEKQKADAHTFTSTFEQEQRAIYFISEGENIEEALMAYENSKTALECLLEQGVLSKISGLSVYLPSQSMQRERLNLWKLFCEENKEKFALIDKISVENGFKPEAFSLFDSIVNTNFEVQEIHFFEPLTSTLAGNYIVNRRDGDMVVTLLHTKETDVNALESALNAIDRNSFSFDSGTIGRSVFNSLSGDFNKVLFICGSIVFIFLILALGRLELALLAFLPLTIGWFWILGIMDIFDIRFNIINIILATFIFGQGDDYTIFMTEGLMYEYSYKRKVLKSYKSSILLSSIIMFIGIGALIFAKHPALRSLAEVTVIGMATVVLMTFILPPVFFNWLTMNKGKRRLMPVTLKNLISSIYVLLVFIFGSIAITIADFFLFTFGKPTEKKKFLLHRLLCWVARFVIVRIPYVKTTYNKFSKTLFDKPAVIICNHQSYIDLMCVMSLTPKLVILTNDWVWNSPFFGRFIKHADYYPVSNGIENAMGQLQDIVKKGYSIMIFPEGTRSEDCTINRFHRGAFYLAEQLKLDIIPVLIHGVGHFLPKKEFMLRKGEIHINVFRRMAYNEMGKTAGESAKNMRKFYVTEYQKLAEKVETPHYFSDVVIHNYIYKGPSVERTVRRNLKKNNNYCELINHLSNYRSVVIMNCGYGELPLLLSLVHKNMHIVATDSDTNKLELAANCTWVKENLKYVEKVDDVKNFDAVVLKISNPIAVSPFFV